LQSENQNKTFANIQNQLGKLKIPEKLIFENFKLQQQQQKFKILLSNINILKNI